MIPSFSNVSTWGTSQAIRTIPLTRTWSLRSMLGPSLLLLVRSLSCLIRLALVAWKRSLLLPLITFVTNKSFLILCELWPVVSMSCSWANILGRCTFDTSLPRWNNPPLPRINTNIFVFGCCRSISTNGMLEVQIDSIGVGIGGSSQSPSSPGSGQYTVSPKRRKYSALPFQTCDFCYFRLPFLHIKKTFPDHRRLPSYLLSRWILISYDSDW